MQLDIEEFLAELRTKRRAYEESINKDEKLAKTKQILKENRKLESSIATVVEKHFNGKK